MGEPFDIGQEWALRWLNKNHPVEAPRNQSPIDAVDYCQDVANAVNAHAVKKLAEFEAVLRRTLMDALEGETEPKCVRVSAADLLESDRMTFLGRKITHGVERPRRFPVNLHS
ncbi:hypothetical protein [Candidatus Poriferisodalis sp.]|uniref:hypothetical protein n=1 Tax=Candidatus Poriferisodalis sp. TaxID=3101277 RepID=UPI003B022F16